MQQGISQEKGGKCPWAMGRGPPTCWWILPVAEPSPNSWVLTAQSKVVLQYHEKAVPCLDARRWGCNLVLRPRCGALGAGARVEL